MIASSRALEGKGERTSVVRLRALGVPGRNGAGVHAVPESEMMGGSASCVAGDLYDAPDSPSNDATDDELSAGGVPFEAGDLDEDTDHPEREIAGQLSSERHQTRSLHHTGADGHHFPPAEAISVAEREDSAAASKRREGQLQPSRPIDETAAHPRHPISSGDQAT